MTVLNKTKTVSIAHIFALHWFQTAKTFFGFIGTKVAFSCDKYMILVLLPPGIYTQTLVLLMTSCGQRLNFVTVMLSLLTNKILE